MNVQNPDAQQTERLFATGWGQSDTHTTTMSDGKPNPHKSAGTPYTGISAREIAAMMAAPGSCPKEDAQWFLPSTYREADARNHAAQRQQGIFWWLTLDVDQNNLALSDIEAALDVVVPESVRLIYSTRSAKPDLRKWRALLPLAAALAGQDYSDTQNAFFSALEDASEGFLIPDRRLANANQLIYLPNRGDFYEHSTVKGQRLALTPEHPIIIRRDAERAKVEAAKAEAKAYRDRKARERGKRPQDADLEPGDAFNANHDIEALLAKYGYQRLGASNDWRSPMQASGSYATRACGEYWISLSGSDAAAGIGMASKSGARTGDAFDLFVHFEHGGDFKAAVRAYGQEMRALDFNWTEASEGRKEEDKDMDGSKPTSDGQPRPNFEADMDLSQDALASDMGAKGWNSDARHVALWGKWLFWTGTHWQRDDKLDHMTRTRAYLRQRAEDLAEWAEGKTARLDAEEEGKGDKLRGWAKEQARNLRSKNTIAAIESLARSNADLVASAKDFDRDRLLLGTPGGTVDLRTGQLRTAHRSDMLTMQTAVAPAPGTPSLWLAFLHQIFDGDPELIAFMQRAAGYALTGETREHKLLFLYGTGRNGKSVFLNTMFHIYGATMPAAPMPLRS